MGMNAIALGLVLLSAGASPGHPDGLYAKLSGVWVQQEGSDLTSEGVPGTFSLEFDSGYGVMGGVGYTFSLDMPVSISVELEYAFRSAEVDTASLPPIMIPASGPYDSHSVMANAIAAVDLGGGLGLYGGVGVGATITTADLAFDFGGGFIDAPTEDDVTFSWQVLGGVQLSLGRTLLLYGGVRYFDAGEVDLDAIETDNASFAVEAGVRVYF